MTMTRYFNYLPGSINKIYLIKFGEEVTIFVGEHGSGKSTLLEAIASLHRQSHGVSFLWLIFERFSGHGLYILNEPEAISS